MTPAEEYINSIKGKKVAFVGMGVANTPCAEFLAKNGIETYACDMRDKKYIGEDVCKRLESLGVHFSLGEHYLDVLPQMDIVFRSHGILANVSKEDKLSQQKWKCFSNTARQRFLL